MKGHFAVEDRTLQVVHARCSKLCHKGAILMSNVLEHKMEGL